MITVCGEALVDLTDEGGGTFRARPGGSPLNVAVGLARLGQPTSMVTRLGTDPFGELLRTHLTDNGVSDRDLVSVTDPATLAVVSFDPAGQARYAFYVTGTTDGPWLDGELPDPLPDDVRAVHVGSLASWLPPAADAVEDLVDRARGSAVVSFDPNVRPALITDPAGTRARIDRLVRKADVVKVSVDDLAWIAPDRDWYLVAEDWRHAGPALVVVTRGEEGMSATTATTGVTSAVSRVTVVDTVGAGDAFTAGMLADLAEADLLGPQLRAKIGELDAPALGKLLRLAQITATVTCTRRGADPPTRAELAAFGYV